MKNYIEEYYFMTSTGNDSPLLDFVNSMTDSFLLNKEHELDENHLVKFRFGEPIPRNPKMGDVHENGYYLVISDKLKDALQAMHLKDVQYLPATIQDTKNAEIYKGYWSLHIYNLIYCMDKEQSKFRSNSLGHISNIKKLFFDNNALTETPLEERLVFALGEKGLYMFFHASVVEKLMELQLTGVGFCSLAQWNNRYDD